MSKKAENTGLIQGKHAPKGKFAKGKSGNPKGRPKGSLNKVTLAVANLIESDAEAITKKAIEMAKAGDLTAIRICIERILPPRKVAPMQFPMPQIEKPEDVLPAVNAIISAVSMDKITVDQADALLRTIETARKSIETEELHRELNELQTKLDLING